MRRGLASLVLVVAMGCEVGIEDDGSLTGESADEVRGSKRRPDAGRPAGPDAALPAGPDAGAQDPVTAVLVGNTAIEPVEDWETVGDADAFE
ncbi:MAG: hypothetical protein HY901_00690, partial [Deltaproteobacteria bacterium]|nr:hypothetical protein [Deltaproteobacteria bacterium]